MVGWIADYLAPESHKYRARRMGRRMGKAQFTPHGRDRLALS
jgi:hypothetical protein